MESYSSILNKLPQNIFLIITEFLDVREIFYVLPSVSKYMNHQTKNLDYNLQKNCLKQIFGINDTSDQYFVDQILKQIIQNDEFKKALKQIELSYDIPIKGFKTNGGIDHGNLEWWIDKAFTRGDLSICTKEGDNFTVQGILQTYLDPFVLQQKQAEIDLFFKVLINDMFKTNNDNEQDLIFKKQYLIQILVKNFNNLIIQNSRLLNQILESLKKCEQNVIKKEDLSEEKIIQIVNNINSQTNQNTENKFKLRLYEQKSLAQQKNINYQLQQIQKIQIENENENESENNTNQNQMQEEELDEEQKINLQNEENINNQICLQYKLEDDVQKEIQVLYKKSALIKQISIKRSNGGFSCPLQTGVFYSSIQNILDTDNNPIINIFDDCKNDQFLIKLVEKYNLQIQKTNISNLQNKTYVFDTLINPEQFQYAIFCNKINFQLKQLKGSENYVYPIIWFNFLDKKLFQQEVSLSSYRYFLGNYFYQKLIQCENKLEEFSDDHPITNIDYCYILPKGILVDLFENKEQIEYF